MAMIPTQPDAIRPSAFEIELQKRDEGLLQNVPDTVSIVINGTPMNPAQMDATLRGYLEYFKAVERAKQAYLDAVNARRGISLDARAFYKALKAAFKLYFGPQSPRLASFGIPADGPHKADTKTLAVALANAAQIRAVRGTDGEKLAVEVVGEPSVTFGADGQLQVGPRALNLPAASGGTTPAPESSPAATPAPAGSGSGTPGTGSGTGAA